MSRAEAWYQTSDMTRHVCSTTYKCGRMSGAKHNIWTLNARLAGRFPNECALCALFARQLL